MNTKDFPWPNVRRSIFHMEGPRVDSTTKCFIRHMGMSSFGYDYLSDQYKRAADIIVKARKNESHPYHLDGLFMPVAYLYRHAIELKLKGLLEKLIQCELCNDDSTLSRHDLLRLWQKVKPILINQWPTADRKPLSNVEALLNDFHKIDNSGQSLRYHILRNGTDVRSKFPEIVRLEALSEAFNEMYSLLDGCSMYFENILTDVEQR